MKKQSFLSSLFILLLLALFLSKAQISFGDSVETGNETVTGNLVVGGNATITGNVSMSSIENTPIGKNQPNTGRFTDISGTMGSFEFIGVNHMSLTGALGMTATRITAEDANFVSAKHTSLYATNLNARNIYTEQGAAGAGDIFGFIGSGQSSMVKSGQAGTILTASPSGVGNMPSFQKPVAAQSSVYAYRNAPYTTTISPWVPQMPYDTEFYDLGNEYDPSTGIFKANSTGTYLVNACLNLNTTPGVEIFSIGVYVNGTRKWFHNVATNSSVNFGNCITTIVSAIADQTITIGYYQQTTATALTNLGENGNFLQIQRLY